MEHPMDRKRRQARAEQTIRDMVSRNMERTLGKPAPTTVTSTATITEPPRQTLKDLRQLMQDIFRIPSTEIPMAQTPAELMELAGTYGTAAMMLPHPLTGR